MQKPTSDRKSSLLKRLFKWLAWTSAVLGVLAALYVGCVYLFAPEIPSELLKPPDEIVDAFKSQRPAPPPSMGRSYSPKPSLDSSSTKESPSARKNVISNYTKFLDALPDDHPDRAAIDLYQELYNRFYQRDEDGVILEREFRERIGENRRDYRRRGNAWKFGEEPVPAHVLDWMLETRVAEFIELSGQFADTSGPPVPIVQTTSIPDEAGALSTRFDPTRSGNVVVVADGRTGMELGVSDGSRAYNIDIQLRMGLMQGVTMMMAAEGRRCLEEDEPEAAMQWYRRIFRIVWMLRSAGTVADETHEIVGAVLDLLTEWIEEIPCPTEIREQWLASLDEMHSTLFSPRTAMSGLQKSAIEYRRWMVDALSTTWGSLSMSMRPEYCYPDDIDIFVHPPFAEGPVKIQIDRYDKMAAGYIMALNDRKKAPRLIEDYDKFLKETMALAVMDYPDIMAETNGTISPPHGSYRDTILYLYWHMPCRSFRRELIGSLAEEARFNLLRAALTASLGTDRAVEAAQPDFIPSRDHPWRDPFTARCLRSDRATSPTLIYSLGPDMTSQSGSDTFRFKTWNATHSVKSNLNLSMSGGRTGQEGASTSPMTWKDRVGVDIPEGDFSIRVGYQR